MLFNTSDYFGHLVFLAAAFTVFIEKYISIMVSSEVEGFLNDLVLDVSKAALKSQQLDDMHESDTEIYLFLYIFFQRAAMRQKREDAIAASEGAIRAVLRQVLVPALAQASSATRPSAKAAVTSAAQPAVPSYRKTSDAPIVQQRTLREQLQSLSPSPNLTAFAEVVEVCRFVDQQLGVPSVFGSVNLVHFVAVFVTLMPHRRLFELIRLIWEMSDIPEARRVQIFYVWSVVDKQNRDALVELCEHFETRPGLTIPILLEFFPNAENINTSKYPRSLSYQQEQPAAAARPALSTSAITSGKSIVHSEDDSGVCAASAAPLVVKYGEHEGDHDDDEYDDGRTDEDRAFWADLVA
jgi:hypothetical protein